jgi:hypothetical protein
MAAKQRVSSPVTNTDNPKRDPNRRRCLVVALPYSGEIRTYPLIEDSMAENKHTLLPRDTAPVKRKRKRVRKVVDIPNTAKVETSALPADTAAAMAVEGSTHAVMIGTPPPENLVFETPDGQPNISIKVFTPLVAVLARCGTVFFSSLLGGLGLSATAELLPVSSGIPFVTWKLALGLAASAALAEGVRSMVTISSSLEKKYPLLRA